MGRQGDVSEELDYIDSCLHEERKVGKVSYVELFTKPGLRFRLFVACYLQAAQQMTGVNAFLGFQTDIFHAAGYQSDQIDKFPEGPAMITQWVFIVGAVGGLLLIDSPYGGRKRQLLGASLFMGPPLLVAAVTHFVKGPAIITGYMVWIFSFGFQAAWGIVPWFYPAEIFQMNERARLVYLLLLRFPLQLVHWLDHPDLVPLEPGWHVPDLWHLCHILHEGDQRRATRRDSRIVCTDESCQQQGRSGRASGGQRSSLHFRRQSA